MNTRANRTVQSDAQTVGDRHAVVLGGSLAGLLAARILADHFERVTLIERDAYIDTTAVRKGIPQANHVHGLLLRGRQVLEELFPGMQDEMIADGAPLVDMANDIPWYTRAGWGIRFPSDLKVLAFTRPLLDLYVRRRLAQNSRIEICDNMEVLSLVDDAEGNRVAGVLVIPRVSDVDKRVARQLRADLVIDATGRASRAPRWLKDLGYDVPRETVINAHIGYASRLYRIPENFNDEWTCAYVQSAPPQRKRGGILFRVEDNRWLVTLLGGGGDYPPSDEQGFLEFADSLPVSIIADAIRSAEPVAPIRTHRGTENRLRHFDRVKNLPENFLVLGDAACAFNPVYGQGMTIASLGALTLNNCLREQQKLHPDGSFHGLSRRFQRRLGQVNKAPWLMATGEDYRYREAEGGSPSVMTRFMHWYMDQVLRLATQEVAVRSVLLRVFNLLLPPSALFRTTVLFRVVGQAVRPAGARDVAPKRPRQALYDVERRYGRETS
ncbi:MAG TPA: FAD-dependent monooxygenase [Pyrinomonadaceae bacterium]|nr:FAD-dependent monooxygenase [Pyrinomonadaceae bacterium]